MKRLVFLASLLVSMMLMNFSVSQAATVRVADIGVYNLIQDMRTTIRAANKEITNYVPVTIGNAVRVPQIDKNYTGCSGWVSKIYKKGTNEQKALITFYVNGQGYISRINFLLLDTEDPQQLAGKVFGLMFLSLRMSEDDLPSLLQSARNVQLADDDTRIIHESIYCSAKKRYFDLDFYSVNYGHLNVDITGRI